jgi:hypothetical protein
MAVPWALRLGLTQLLGDGLVSAELIDPVAQGRVEFP